MKKKLGNVVLVLFFIGILLFLLSTAILDLTNKRDLHTVKIDGASEILELEHSINGLIPIGTDYYYIGFEGESYDAYIIKASKKWLENNFDSNFMAKKSDGIQITALAKKVSDYKTARELYSRATQIEGVNYPLGTEYCLDMGYKANAITKLIIFSLIIFLAFTGVKFVKNKGEVKPWFVKYWIIVLMVTLVLLLGVIR